MGIVQHVTAIMKQRFPAPLVRALALARGLVRGSKQLVAIDGPVTYNQDGLATVHHCDFLTDPRFTASYAKGKATGSWEPSDPAWRAYVCCWAAARAARMTGDFVECGVNRGGMALTVMSYIGFERLDRRFYLLDTFDGFRDQYLTPGERRRNEAWHNKEYQGCYDYVVDTFSGFRNVSIIRGTVPDTLAQITADKIAYLSLDMNCVAPEIAAAEHLWDRLVGGAVIILDDYGWYGFEEQQAAFDRFAAERGVQVLSLPTGQGLIFKP